MESGPIEIPPPGEFIREELQERGWSQRDLAYVLGTPEQAVNMIVSGKRGISADMARALGEAFDVPAEFFLNLQAAFDVARARTPDPSVSKKARLQASYPVREMIKRGWLLDVDGAQIESEMARFFGVKSAEEIPHIALAHAAKKSRYNEVPPAQLAWLLRVRKLAGEMVVGKFSESSLRRAIDDLRSLMVAPEECRHVPRILAECGIRFLIVEGLPGGKIDGACFWLRNGSSPVVCMSLRYDRIDNFWFVLRHELEHVLRRDGVTHEVIDNELEGDRAGDDDKLPEEERAANRAATDFCVSQKDLNSFIARKSPYFSDRDLLAFAARLGVHPGIVAGQLRRRLNNWKVFGRHLVKVRHILATSAVVDGWGDTVPVTQ